MENVPLDATRHFLGPCKDDDRLPPQFHYRKQLQDWLEDAPRH